RAIVQLARERERAGVLADEQQALTRSHLHGDPPEYESPRDDRSDGERRSRREDAAIDGELWEQRVDGGENQQRGAERLQRADQQLRAVLRDVRVVVEIAVVETHLTNRRDDQRL